MLYRNESAGHPVNMNGSFDHAVACHNCYNWATRNGFQPMLKKYADEKMKSMHCPVCFDVMKTNMEFQLAKCNRCGFEFCWQDPMKMAMSILNLTRLLAKKRGIEMREPTLADALLDGLDRL